MEREMKVDTDVGVTISLPIPAHDSDLFKHKASNEILLFLSRHRIETFTIGELATRTEHPKPTVGRAVDILHANDLVSETPDGNRRLIQINRERLSVPEDPFLQIPQIEFHKPVHAAVNELTANIDNLLGIILYGSVARGDADRLSDIDLWVLVSENRAATQRTVNELRQELEARTFDGERYGFDIDVEAVSSLPRYTDDIREIVLSGIPLYKNHQFDTVEDLLLTERDSDEY